ncbi:MAG: hypothetical protein GF350_05140 [Chitinivibrionales bacterium]|nr:hypothetical protein [Chitinivibrionales bacterium]
MTADIQGSGHQTLSFSQTDYSTRQRSGILSADNGERNLWSLDDYFQYEECWGDPPQCRVEHVGGGMWTENNWSCNSEYWTATIHGWSPSGREMSNGSNLIIINWDAQQSLNVTRIPHANKTNLNADNIDSTIDAGDEVLHADFWVSAPESDIYPDLRNDVTNRDSYAISCLDDNESCQSPSQETNLDVTSKAHMFPPGEYFDGREHSVVYFVDSIQVFIATKTWSKYGDVSEEEGTTIRYTLDGSWPSENSTLCPDTVTLTETATLSALAFKDGQAPSWWPTTVSFVKVDPAPGLVYEYFWNFTSEVIPHYPLYGSGMGGGECGGYCRDKGIIETITIENATDPDRYGYRFWGYIDIQQEGDYTFYMTADDAAKLFIDGRIIIDKDGPLAGTPSEGSGTINLSEGMHPLVITYHQSIDDAVLDVQWSGPGINKQPIPSSALFHADAPIDSVLPPHYEHYDSLDGTSIVAANFSDGHMLIRNVKVTTDQKGVVSLILPDTRAWTVELCTLDGRVIASKKVQGTKAVALRKPVSSGILVLRIMHSSSNCAVRLVNM